MRLERADETASLGGSILATQLNYHPDVYLTLSALVADALKVVLCSAKRICALLEE